MRKRKEKPPTENPTGGLLSQNRSNNRLAQHKEVMQWEVEKVKKVSPPELKVAISDPLTARS